MSFLTVVVVFLPFDPLPLSEDSGTVSECVTLLSPVPTERDVEVMLATNDGTGTVL